MRAKIDRRESCSYSTGVLGIVISYCSLLALPRSPILLEELWIGSSLQLAVDCLRRSVSGGSILLHGVMDVLSLSSYAIDLQLDDIRKQSPGVCVGPLSMLDGIVFEMCCY